VYKLLNLLFAEPMLDTLAEAGRMSPFALVFIPTPVAPVTPVAPIGAIDPNKVLKDIAI
jgi:hypothetical protein